ncbi:MAG: hypothetical protein ACLVJH_10105 [Faecalibacterium prausnitzii]
MGNKEKYFKFTVQLTGEEGKTYQDSYAITGGSYDANPDSVEIQARRDDGKERPSI